MHINDITSRKEGVMLVILLGLFFAASFCFAKQNNWSKSSDSKFSRWESRWAVKWINSELSFFMGNGVLKQIISKKDVFDIRVGEPWYRLEFVQKADFLTKLSRARQITEHDPFFDVRDHKTNEVVARVSENSIEILLRQEGFFEYQVENQGGRNTYY